MKNKTASLALACIALVAPIHAAAPSSDSVRTIAIVANDNMRFSVTRIEAAPGEKLRVQFRNGGTLPKEVMGHNWVLLNAEEAPDAYASAAVSAKADHFQPASLQPKVLAAVPILGPGQTGEVVFTAPTAPGKYAYLCSFPAHCAAGMRGELIVH
jgi:azurin